MLHGRYLIAALLLLLGGAYAPAQYCNTSLPYRLPAPIPCEAPAYVNQSCNNQIVLPVAVPTVLSATVFQYLPALQPTIVSNGIVPTGGVVQGVAPTQAAPAVQATQAAPVSTPAPSMADIDKLVEAKMSKMLSEAYRNSEDGPPPVPELKNEPTDAKPPTRENAPADAKLPTAQLSPEVNLSAAVAVLQTNCASCHGGANISGGVRLFDIRGHWAPSVSNDQIIEAVQTAKMPKGAAGNIRHPKAIRGKQLGLVLTGLSG